MVKDQQMVFKALADHTRRSILDLLRKKPYTTGDISKKFNKISRIAVMKHLNVLKEANLVYDKKIGREHWYRLNVIPLMELYNRWMRPYEEIWASNLVDLKYLVENS